MTMFIGDIEGDNLLDEITKFHCFTFKPFGIDLFYVFCNQNELSKAEKKSFDNNQFGAVKFFDLNLYDRFLNSKKTTGIIIHNLFGFDFPAVEKLSTNDFTFDYNSINGRQVNLIDSLVLSRYLNPERRLPKGCPPSVLNEETGRKDRIVPHGLEAWGWRTGVAKPKVHDWRTQPLHVYVNRCIEDVKINEFAYNMMLEEIKDVAISNGKKEGNWERPLKMSQRVYHLMCKQERTGVLFNQEKAETLIVQIDEEMGSIETEIEPTLGERILPSGKQPTPPTNQWKKAFDYEKPWTTKGKLKNPVRDYLCKIGYTDEDSQVKYINGMITVDTHGERENNVEELIQKDPSLLTTTAVNYCKKFGIVDSTGMLKELDRVAKGGSLKLLKEKLKLKHKKDVKEFLIKDGWEPTIWKYRNIIVNKKTKQNLSDEEVEVKYQKYMKEFYKSCYWPFILKDLGYSNKKDVDVSTPAFKKKVLKKGRGLMSSPQYADQRGERCINLKKLLGETSKKIIKWLSLQNRRTTIKSFDKDTGWLNHPRLPKDGRLPARASGVTPTSRQKHSVVVNVPKPKDHVVLGKEMRELFEAPEFYWQVGCDASGIEQRVGGHYAFYFDGGVYASDLLEGDAHTKNAIAYSKAAEREINRDDGKNLTYAIMYGASMKKIALMASVKPDVGQGLIDAFWDANEGLKQAKEALEQYWMQTGKKYVMGIDGRKIFTRSKHSLLNSLFQSTGAIIMDFAGCWADEQIHNKYHLNAERTLYVHDEYQWNHHKDEVKIVTFADWEPEIELKKKVKPSQIKDGKQWSAPEFNKLTGEWTQYYSQVGELIAKGIEAAGLYYKMNLPFPGEYKVGKNWSDCH